MHPSRSDLSIARRARWAFSRALLLASFAFALAAANTGEAQTTGPTGGTVVGGSATIGAPDPSTTLITQSSEATIINWQSFSIATGSTVQFIQPDAAAIALNRVIGPGMSDIEGSLLANGQVWLINGNGILFGKGSTINVGSLIATTADMNDSDFLAGKYSFGKPSNNANASVVNQGTITAAKGGAVVLAGASVSNQGLISANFGKVVLASGSTFSVDFSGDNLLRFSVDSALTTTPLDANGNPQAALVSNSGTISATGGQVTMTARAASSVVDNVVNNTGVIEATSASNHNGEIILDAGDGTVNAGGTLEASGNQTGQTGGTVEVLGRTVNVSDGAQINASGAAGGGTILIGGNFHGAGPQANAQTTTIGKATITADATQKGNGGNIAIWSEGTTTFNGSVSARGGAKGGNGGFVETSGQNLSVGSNATVNTMAPKGVTGTWLLDPDYIYVETTGEGDPLSCASSTCTIDPTTITDALETTNVTLDATQDIYVFNNIEYNSPYELTFLAQHDIYIAANVQNAGSGAINAIAGWDGETGWNGESFTLADVLSTPGSYGNGGGTVYVTSDYDLDPDEDIESEASEGEAANAAIGSAGGTTTVAGSDVQVLGYFGSAQIGYNGAGSGEIDVFATNNVTLTASANGECESCYAQIGNGGVSGAGNVGGNVTVNAGGDVTLNAGATIYSYAQIGNGGDSRSSGDDSGNILVSAGGSVALNGDGDYAQIGNGGYGANGDNSGSITVEAGGDVALSGSQNSEQGFGYTQIGNGGQNADGSYSGDIKVSADGEIDLYGGADISLGVDGNYARIGNGGGGASGNPTGDIEVVAGGVIDFESDGEGGGNAWLGNTTNSGVESGNVTLIAASNAGDSLTDIITTDLGTTESEGSGGNFTLGFTSTDGMVIDSTGGLANYNSPNALTILSAGNIDIASSFQNAGAGALTFVAGWDPLVVTADALATATDNSGEEIVAGAAIAGLFASTPDSFAQNGGSVTVGGEDAEGDVAVGSAGGTTTVLTDNLTIDAVNGYAQLGYHGAGGGDIYAIANGDIVFNALTSKSDRYALLGNGSRNDDVEGDITGDINVYANGKIQFNDCVEECIGSGAAGWIGNSAGSENIESGNLTVIAAYTDDNGVSDASGNSFGDMILAALGTTGSENSGGDVTVGLMTPNDHDSNTMVINNGFSVDTPNDLTIMSGSGITVTGSIQNSGTGNVTLIAGWDPTVVTAQDIFTTAGSDGSIVDLFTGQEGSYGLDGASVYLGGPDAEGDVAVGTAGGTTTVLAGGLTMEADNGYAQLGYHGTGSGPVNVDVTGAIQMTGSSGEGDFVLIGNGTSLSSNAGSGNVMLDAHTIDVEGTAGQSGVVADALTINLSGDGSDSSAVGSAALPLSIAVNTLAVKTNGASAYLTSPSQGLSIGVDGDGIAVGSGSFVLSAGGAITQSAKIVAHALDISTTSGAITLTNCNNDVGSLTIATSGSDNASFTDKNGLVVSLANVGGTLTLAAGGALTQTGSIHANALNVSTTSGAIMLTNTANVFSSLNVATAGSNNASIADSTGVSVTGATVGGTLTLAAGGAITQTGAILANALNVSTTSGAITLTNASNNVGSLTIATSGSDNASFTDQNALVVTSATVGGTLTLAAGGALSQTGAIHANALVASTTSGAITLTNLGNVFNAITVNTTGTDDASVYDSTAMSVTSATVGGNLTLAAGGAITQTGAIHTNALNVSTTSGAITLTNSGNGFNSLTVATAGADNASLTDSTALSVTSATVGGNLTLAAGGALTQTGAIHSNGLTVSTTSGAITLTDAGNAFNSLGVTTAGSSDASVTDSTAVSVTGAMVGGNLTLAAGGAITQTGAIDANAFNVSTTSGAITLTNSGNGFNSLTVSTAGSSDASLTDSTALSVTSATVGGNLTFAAGGALTQTGAIHANGLNVSTTSGAITLTNAGNAFNSLTVATAGSNDASLTDSTGLSITSANVGGNLTLAAGGAITQTGAIHSNALTASATSGAITLTNVGNAVAGLVQLTTSAAASFYNSITTIVGSMSVGGDLTLLSKGNIDFTTSVQLTGGSLTAVAGWDGTTVTPAQFTAAGVYGNNGGDIVIGGSGASGNVAVGSLNGTTTLAAATVSLEATNGYAQIGYHGAATGTIYVYATGNVVLQGGSGTNEYAQIGNGGQGTSGDESGAINVSAGGDVLLNGGAGHEAYAQIGHGGAESNTGSNGYSNTGTITVHATNVTLSAGTGSAAYTQIGHGGYEVGAQLAGGTATNSGDISVIVTHAVTITGNGNDAYAQIGNGGDQSNTGASASAHGENSGNITVTAPNGSAGSVTLTAGSGSNAYAAIGNGGYASNASPQAVPANFTDSGNISVTDLTLQGGSGDNAYAQIGNGDASQTGTGDVSGDITIDANGNIVFIPGTGANTNASIGNDTGNGTVSGTITGYSPAPPFTPTDPATNGVVASLTSQDPSTTGNLGTFYDEYQLPPESDAGATGLLVVASDEGNNAIETLAGDEGGGENTASDSLTTSVADSLSKSKPSNSQTIMSGLVHQLVPVGSNTPHGVPPADQEYSSWGNEALWR